MIIEDEILVLLTRIEANQARGLELQKAQSARSESMMKAAMARSRIMMWVCLPLILFAIAMLLWNVFGWRVLR